LYPLGYKYIFETKFRIEVYQDSDGQSPFEDWLNSLDDKTAKAKILARITRLSYGNFGDSKPLQNADVYGKQERTTDPASEHILLGWKIMCF